jgi:TolB protein
VRFRLWDIVRGQDIGGQNYVVAAGDLRLAAHRIADFIYEKLTGERGVFSTRIAYVTKAGRQFNLWVADADGENAQAALSSPEPIISPAWAPDGQQLAYVSFESRKPVVELDQVGPGRPPPRGRRPPRHRPPPRGAPPRPGGGPAAGGVKLAREMRAVA